jgi:hypothetical protein
MAAPYFQRVMAHDTTPREARANTRPKLAVCSHIVRLSSAGYH